MIPVFRPSITQAEIDAVTEVLKSGWLGLGPVTAKFEEEFAKAIGVPVAVGFNSGTAALHLGLDVLVAGNVVAVRDEQVLREIGL